MRIKISLILGLLLCIFSLYYAYAEEAITITTYYPSPYGSYNELAVASRQAIGDLNGDGKVDSADMAADVGGPITGSLTVRNRIGINTTSPQYSLDVNGDIMARSGNGIWLGGVRRTTWAGVNVTYASASAYINNGNTTVTATCPTGYVRTGCSGWLSGYMTSPSGFWNTYQGAQPSGANSCTAGVQNSGTASPTISITAYAYCAQ